MSDQQQQKKDNRRFTVKDFFKLIFTLVALAFFFWIVIYTFSQPKNVATATQMWNVLETEGYVPQDLTQNRLDKEPNCGIIKNITVNNNDIYFVFAEFDGNSSANNAYAAYRGLIREKEQSPDMGYHIAKGNYSIYTVNIDGKYYAAICVGNTIVFATCNSENQSSVDKLLISVNYLTPSHTDKLSEVGIGLVKIAMYCIVLLPLTSICLSWLWDITCKSAGATRQEFKKYRIENRPKLSFKSSRYYWLVHKSGNQSKTKKLLFLYKACFLPSRLAVLTAGLGLFVNSAVLVCDYFSYAAIIIIVVGGTIKTIYNRIYLPKQKSV